MTPLVTEGKVDGNYWRFGCWWGNASWGLLFQENIEKWLLIRFFCCLVYSRYCACFCLTLCEEKGIVNAGVCVCYCWSTRWVFHRQFCCCVGNTFSTGGGFQFSFQHTELHFKNTSSYKFYLLCVSWLENKSGQKCLCFGELLWQFCVTQKSMERSTQWSSLIRSCRQCLVDLVSCRISSAGGCFYSLFDVSRHVRTES